jgi:general stress protein 26
MSRLPLEKNWIIWLGTNPRSRKVQQIKNNPNVMVFYYDSKGASYVSVSGKAIIVNDPDKKAHHWKESWANYYPDRDKDYILIEVTPKRLEIVSYKYRLFWPNERPHFVEF